MRFLIIDNNQDDRERIKQGFQKEFYGLEFLEVIKREDFNEAIAQGNFDVVLTDHLQNWTDGLWILRTIKARFPDIPVIMVTNTGNEEIAVEGMKSGLSDYILKRHLHRLPVAVRESLEKIRLRKEYEANKQLRDAEAKYYKLLETANDAIFIADAATGIIIDANKRAEDLLGYSREEIIGMHHIQLHPAEEATHYTNIFEDPVRAGKALTKDLYVRHKNGHKIPVEINASVTLLGDKKIIHGFFRNITESENINEELKIFKMLFSEIRDLAYICDTQGNILYVNKIFEKFTGHKPEEFFGKSFSPLFDEENLEKAMDAHTRTVKGESLQFELYFKNTGILCEYRNFQLRDNQGNIIRTIGIARDITERKNAEEAIRETNQTLQALIQASPLAIIALGPHGNVTMWNLAAERMFGWNQQEVLGHPLPIVPDDKQEESRALRERVLRGESFAGVEVSRQKRDGSPIDISISTAPLRDRQGNISGIMGVVADITEHKRTQAIDTLLHKIDQLVLQGQTLDFILPYVCTRLVDIFAYPLVWIGMKEADGAVSISAKAGIHTNYLNGFKVRWDNTPDGQCTMGLAVRSKKTQTSSDTQEPAIRQCLERAFRYGFQSFAAVPLLVNDKILGALNLYALKPNAFDTETIRLLENLATRISVTLLIAIDQQQLRLHSTAMASVANAVFITDCDGRIKWVNNAFTSLSGYTPEEIYGKTPRLFKSGKHDSPFYQQVWQTILAGKVWRGEVVNRRKDNGLYTVNQTITPLLDAYGKVCHFIAIHEDITAKKEVEERIIYMAHYDALTNLPNRILFCDHLELELAHAHRNGRMVAVMFLDLDRFKIINDTLGHAFGDQLLKAVAERLRGCVREGDTVSRLGGDEFTFILSDITHPQDAVLVVQKILNVMSHSFQVEGHEVHVTPSIGIAMYPSDANDADSLIKKADTAMYHAKEHGKNTFKFYMEDMNVSNFERLTLENGLRKALEKGELLVYYQPLIDQNMGQIISMEALARWQHPDLGMIYPTKFIPIAEETGLIIPIGEWVLMTACTQTRAWHDAGFPTLRVTVNLSACQFKQQNLVNMIIQVLQKTGLDPHYLELELTEGIVMQNDVAILTTLRELKALGILLSIDDFGTEYSSLSYLKRFPIDTLKIDRSFVHDITTNPDDAAIVTAIIAIAESLKLKVVAEGVENKEQAAFLQKLRCNNIQGYVYSHPLPAVDMEHLLQKGYNTEYQNR